MIKPILVLNAGSSSIKFSLYPAEGPLNLLYEGEASGIGTAEAKFEFRSLENGLSEKSQLEGLSSFGAAVQSIVSALDQLDIPKPSAIGHRVVHSGPKLLAHQFISENVLNEIEQATPFAPLHQPIALEIIRESKKHFPGIEQYACFDTVFHQTLPTSVSTYPLPRPLRDNGLHRYGFHGLSCESIVQQFQNEQVPGRMAPHIPNKMIFAHLGSGASITAIRDGNSVDTSMGLTPCGGILMGTRSGDLDPGLILYLLRQYPEPITEQVNQVEKLLNQKSGLLALSALSPDMHVLREAEAHGNEQAALAIKMFCLASKKIIGGYIALMGGLDTLVFTGGIGEHDPLTRLQICEGLETFGVKIGPDRNKSMEITARSISDTESKVKIYVMPAQENRIIAVHVTEMLRQRKKADKRI